MRSEITQPGDHNSDVNCLYRGGVVATVSVLLLSEYQRMLRGMADFTDKEPEGLP
jgi:hypothetical protein